jgi:putative redox protein
MAEKTTRRMDVSLIDGMHFQATGKNNVSVSVDSSDEHGGASAGPTPMELLLVSLGSCTGMDVISILRKKRVRVSAYRVEVTGTVADEYPHVYTHIDIRHVLEGSDVTDEAVRHAIELSETKYCSAYAMLEKAAELTSSYEIGSAGAPD